MIPPPILTHSLSVKTNAARVLCCHLTDIVDALEPGGGGGLSALLSTPERPALSELFALGYSKDRAWLMNTMAGVSDALIGARQGSAEYVKAFWEERGYAGADGILDPLLIKTDATVRKVLTVGDLLDSDAADPVGLCMMLSPAPKGVAAALVVDPTVAVALFTGERVREAAGSGRRFRVLGCIGDAMICFDPSNPLDGGRPGR